MTISLTPTEQKIVHLIAVEHRTYRAAAKIMRCSWHTIRCHIRHVAAKLPGEATAQRKVIAYYGNAAKAA